MARAQARLVRTAAKEQETLRSLELTEVRTSFEEGIEKLVKDINKAEYTEKERDRKIAEVSVLSDFSNKLRESIEGRGDIVAELAANERERIQYEQYRSEALKEGYAGAEKVRQYDRKLGKIEEDRQDLVEKQDNFDRDIAEYQKNIDALLKIFGVGITNLASREEGKQEA